METFAALRASSVPCFDGVAEFRLNNSRVGSNPMLSSSWIRRRSNSCMKFGYRKAEHSKRKHFAVRASTFDGSNPPIAPLQLESPVGQLLWQILASHPHLVPAAAEQQLEKLQTDRDADEQEKEGPSPSGTELVLYRRIAAVKSNERKKAFEEILYALVVQKFMDANVPLIPSISSGQVDSLSGQDEKLERLHSPEAYEMVQNHLNLILGNRLDYSNAVSRLSKLRVGQVYVASVMFGYFLRRVDQRFKLEKSMKVLPRGLDGEEGDIEIEEDPMTARPHPEVSSWAGDDGGAFAGIKPSKLRTYVMSFDGETLQRYAAVRSKEAVSIVEKHTEALFGRPEISITPQGTVDSSKDEVISISFGGLRRLVLEAVTFGLFLWDVESYVDSRYQFVAN